MPSYVCVVFCVCVAHVCILLLCIVCVGIDVLLFMCRLYCVVCRCVSVCLLCPIVIVVLHCVDSVFLMIVC